MDVVLNVKDEEVEEVTVEFDRKRFNVFLIVWIAVLTVVAGLAHFVPAFALFALVILYMSLGASLALCVFVMMFDRAIRKAVAAG